MLRLSLIGNKMSDAEELSMFLGPPVCYALELGESPRQELEPPMDHALLTLHEETVECG